MSVSGEGVPNPYRTTPDGHLSERPSNAHGPMATESGIVRLVRELQSPKAPSSIVVIESGIIRLLSEHA